MLPETALSEKRVKLKVAVTNVAMVASAFVWYLLAFNGLKELLVLQNASPGDTLIIIGINTGAIVVSGIIGTLIVDKLKNRRRFLYYWLVSGIILSIIPLVLNINNLASLGIISAIFGIYFGLGMPTTMGYHSSFANIEGRAKLGGFTFLIIGASFAISSVVQLDVFFGLYIILAVMRLFSLGIFHFLHREEEPVKTVKVKYRNIISNRSFILYFVPWCMFSLINFMTMPIQSQIYPSDVSFNLLTAMENIVIAIVAVISGFIADKLGRKRLIIIGFIMIGIGYAAIGLFSDNLMFSSIIFTITDGTAWGIFYVLFLFTLWGDIGQMGYSDKFFLLGALPYVSSYFMRSLFTPYLQNINVNLIFSFASVFLFLAVLPLIYAPETLSEKVMKDRDLKSYIENAKKKAVKESQKNSKKQKPTIEEKQEANESAQVDKNYEDAKKLAEKYY